MCALAILAGLVCLLNIAFALYSCLVFHTAIGIGEGNPNIAFLELVTLGLVAPVLVYMIVKLVTYKWELK